VVDEGLAGDLALRVAKLVSAGGDGAPTRVPPALTASAYHGRRAGKAVAREDWGEALTELRRAEEGGDLTEAVDGLRRSLGGRLRSALIDGETVPAAQRFARGTKLAESADLELATALEALLRGDAEAASVDAREAVARAVDAGETPPPLGVRGIDDYGRAHAGRFDGLAPELVERIDLIGAGFDLHTQLATSDLPPGRTLSRREQRALAERLAERPPPWIYVENTELLNRLDWDGAPGPSLARIARARAVAWREIPTGTLGEFRPGRIVERRAGETVANGGGPPRDGDGGGFVRRPIPAGDQPPWLTTGETLLVLVTCDENDDREVSREEEERCVA
jgi:hypothetical protein